MKGIDLDTLLDPEKRIEALEDCVRDLRDAWLVEHGSSFPCSKSTPVERLRLRGMVAAYALVGHPAWIKKEPNSSKLIIGEPEAFKQLRADIEHDERQALTKDTTQQEDE